MFRRNGCSHDEESLWEYAAGASPREAANAMEKRLRECAACREALEAYLALAHGVASLREAEPPASQANWEALRVRLEASPRVSASPMRVFSFKSLGLCGAAFASVCAIALYLRPQTAVGPPNDYLQVAALPVKPNVPPAKDAATAKPPQKPVKGASAAPKAKPKEEIKLDSAFDRREYKRRDAKKSAPMLAKREPATGFMRDVGEADTHTIKFALDAEAPIERVAPRFVMGGVPTGGYSVAPASYEEKELKPW